MKPNPLCLCLKNAAIPSLSPNEDQKNLPLCLCLKNAAIPSLSPNEDQKNLFVCIRCKNSFHISCYDNPTIQILNNSITCIHCRLEIIEPYWSLSSDYLVVPQILPMNNPVDLCFKIGIPAKDTEVIPKDSKVVIFCTKLKSTMTNNFFYEWPSENFEIFLNGIPIAYEIYTFAYIDLLYFIEIQERDGQCQLKIVCKEKLPFNAVIGVAVAQTVEYKEIAKEIAHKNKLSMEESKRKYDELRQNDLEFSVGISIKDPMSSFTLYMPARGLYCDHISCFDLMNFLNFNKTNYNNSRWKCPLCKSVLNITEIVIDLYLYKIVKEMRGKGPNKTDIEKITHIFFDEKGGWKPKDKFSNLWNQNNKGINKEKNELEIISPPPKALPIEKPEKPSQTNLDSYVCIEIQEEEEKKPAISNYYQECLLIIKTFLISKGSKGESCFRILQTFKENPLIKYLALKQFYEMIEETFKIAKVSHLGVLEGAFFQKKKKKLEEICDELKSSNGFDLICRLIIQWSNNKDSLLKIIYILSTKNQQKPLDIFSLLEYLLLISEVLVFQKEDCKEKTNENMNSLPEIFGFFVLSFLDITKTYNKENLKKTLNFISVLIPELHFPNSYSDKSQKNFHKISGFMNSMLRRTSKEEFEDIIFSLYPCSLKEPSFLDLMILKKEFRLWAEIFAVKDAKIYTQNEIRRVIQKWNQNVYLKEQIDKGKLNLIQILNSDL